MRRLGLVLAAGLLAPVLACSGAAGPAVTGPGLGVDDSGTHTDADPTAADPTASTVDPTATTIDPTAADSTAAATTDPNDTATTDPATTDTGPGEPSLRRHTLNLSTGQWSSAALDDVWTGPNAAPPTGILAAVTMTNFDRLLVLADDGYTYQLVEGQWLAPLVTDEHFAVLAGREVEVVTHVPSPDDPTLETLFLLADHSAVLYDLYDTGSVTFVDDVALIDEPGGPPHASGRPRWAFTRARPQDFGQIDWLEWFIAYDDDVLYYADANSQWSVAGPIDANDFFGGAAGEPDPRQASATWYEDDTGRLHVLAP